MIQGPRNSQNLQVHLTTDTFRKTHETWRFLTDTLDTWSWNINLEISVRNIMKLILGDFWLDIWEIYGKYQLGNINLRKHQLRNHGLMIYIFLKIIGNSTFTKRYKVGVFSVHRHETNNPQKMGSALGQWGILGVKKTWMHAKFMSSSGFGDTKTCLHVKITWVGLQDTDVSYQSHYLSPNPWLCGETSGRHNFWTIRLYVLICRKILKNQVWCLSACISIIFYHRMSYTTTLLHMYSGMYVIVLHEWN